MPNFTKLAGAALAFAVVAGATPAAAQYSQSRSGRVAEEIARGVRDAAEAVGTVRDAFDDSVNNVRWRGPERFAVDRCAASVERYGRMRVDDVRRYSRRSWRVYGTVDGGRFDGRSRYDYRGYRPRAFTCTVREDGRVKVKTKKIRY